MTKEEAYNLMYKTQSGKKITGNDLSPVVVCDYLEAIGLIKFEPSKKED